MVMFEPEYEGGMTEGLPVTGLKVNRLLGGVCAAWVAFGHRFFVCYRDFRGEEDVKRNLRVGHPELVRGPRFGCAK
jgi:hypothetical protein